MVGFKGRVSCRNLFRRLEILPLVSQYILSLMLFVVKNRNLNLKNHTKSTRQFNNFYHPITNLTVYQMAYTIWALRSSVIILHTLKTYLMMLGNLKFV